MQIRLTLLTVLFAVLTCKTYSQNMDTVNTKFFYKNSVQLELGGHGLFYSLHYERVLLNAQKWKTTVQGGAAYYPPQSGIIDIWLPLLLNELISFNKHHIEFGLGYVFTNEAIRSENLEVISREWHGFFTGRLGYRYQKPDGRFLLRVAFTPVFEYQNSTSLEMHPLGGLAVGYTFGK